MDQFLLYPNPADNIVNVSQSYNELGQLSIFDLADKKLLDKQIEFNETQMNLYVV